MKKELKEFLVNEKKAVISILLITFVLMVTGSVFPSLKYGINNWAMCNWGITYKAGFVYRGLVGTICAPLLGMITEKKIYYLSIVLLLIIYLLCTFIFIGLYKKQKNSLSFIFVLLVMSQPSNIRWWAVDEMFARMDMFIFILAIVSCIIIIKVNRINMMLILTLLISALALLIHESYGIHFASLLFALSMYKANLKTEKTDLRPIFMYYIPILALLGIVSYFGAKNMDPTELSSVYEKNMSADFSYSMPVVVRQVITDSFSKKVSEVKNLRTPRVFLSLLLTYVVMLPSLMSFFGMIVSSFKPLMTKKKKIFLALSVGAAFAPLAAAFIAYDQFRWIGYFIITLSMCIIVLSYIDDVIMESVMSFVAKNKYLLLFAIVMAISLGTLHDMRGFGYIETLIQRLYS